MKLTHQNKLGRFYSFPNILEAMKFIEYWNGSWAEQKKIRL